MNGIHQKMSLEQKVQTLKEDFLDRARQPSSRSEEPEDWDGRADQGHGHAFLHASEGWLCKIDLSGCKISQIMM